MLMPMIPKVDKVKAMPSKVPAAASTLRILTYLASRSQPVPASRIAAELDIPRSSTYDILAELLTQGFVIHYPDVHAYGLGPSAYELSFGYTRQVPLARLGKRVTERLTERVGESCHIAVLQGRYVLYVVEARASRRSFSLISDVGVRLPAHLTASGRALLSSLPEAQLGVIFSGEQDLESHVGPGTGSGPFPVARVLADARETRARGYAIERGEVTPGIRSVAMPVYDGARWPIASVAVTWAGEDDHRDKEILEGIAEAVRSLQAALR